jgi:Protein of unknown function (DUF2889)
MTIAPAQFPFARQSAGVAPVRRPGSVRRTTSIDTTWQDGVASNKDMRGTARDLLTPADGSEPIVLDAARFHILASPIREILAIEADPDHPRLQEMVGVRAGGASRVALSARLGEMRGKCLFQLLDDFAGASLVAGWIWSQWTDDWVKQTADSGQRKTSGKGGIMTDICSGFAAGSSALGEGGRPDHINQSATIVGPLVNPDDPGGWHDMPDQQGHAQRRARRIDVWLSDSGIEVEAGFQDSGPNPLGSRTAIHEYAVRMRVDGDGRIATLTAAPLILPYRECPGASRNVGRLIGTPVAALRDAVLETLPGPLGCTHLNDVLRALADVPELAKAIR